ncbi:hypothetical protein DSO57_1038225 [Entomophthora muscae]|uniref:Uncharacterized protein n=1 Tax=Entomophthora muscae TaxID=34485 RepID=A0ACC2S0W1_9FUNG|nr:hypothetical protein DSO57_1038225 [Entomophthora muscae]
MKFHVAFLVGTALGQLPEEEEFRPNLKTRADFVEWREKVDLAVRELEQANRTSRSFMGQESLRMVVSGMFASAKGALGCDACKVGVAASSRITQIPGAKPAMLATFKKACSVVKQPRSVCQGIIGSTGPVVYDILANLETEQDDIYSMACFAFGNTCPMPELDIKPMRLPPNSNQMDQAVPSGQTKYVLHITDLHYDRDYEEGAEADCKKPICCQRDSNSDEEDPSHVNKPAHLWGDYKCDINKRLLDSLLGAARKEHDNLHLDMVLFTGDVPAHDMWKEAEKRAMATESEAFGLISKHFSSGFKIYPAIGNHEAVPVNQFPVMDEFGADSYFLYKFMAKEWARWLPSQATSSVRRAGYYSINHSKNLKIITLNNNMCYTLNFYLLINPHDSDPNGMLHWLVSELQDAETRGMRAYIVSHVPPGGTDCYKHWSDQFYRIIQRYHQVIAGQFYGHTHFDEFQLFYSDSVKTKDTAISMAYLAPSITTFGGLNPGFRIYKVDGNSYDVMDFTQYYTNLDLKDTWGSRGPSWEPLYSARETYGEGIVEQGEPLDGKFWHQVTEKFAQSPAEFDTFYKLRTKHGLPQPKCDDECRKTFVCTLRAGRSRDSCAEIDPFS